MQIHLFLPFSALLSSGLLLNEAVNIETVQLDAEMSMNVKHLMEREVAG
jgi:hypothetical protein